MRVGPWMRIEITIVFGWKEWALVMKKVREENEVKLVLYP